MHIVLNQKYLKNLMTINKIKYKTKIKFYKNIKNIFKTI